MHLLALQLKLWFNLDDFTDAGEESEEFKKVDTQEIVDAGEIILSLTFLMV